jgi:chlorophyll synthase
VRFLDAFFALRPLVLVPAWSFFLLGCRADFPALRFLALSLVLSGSYLVNQVVDFESDRLNGKGFFLQRGIFTGRAFAMLGTVLIATGLGLALARRDAVGWTAAAAFLGLAYSLPPVRLVARPGFDLAANAIGYGGIALVLGAGSWSAAGAARVLACGLAVACVFLHTTLLDLEGDRRTGKRTSGVVLGVETSRRLAVLAGVASCAAAARAGTTAVALAAALTAFLALLAWTRPFVVTSRTTVVGATAVFALVAAARFPWFLLALAVLVAATRLYYRRRFGLRYPAL